ncbi:MAG: alpha/beta hydrolase [Opitutales bacterium]|nr:alpha/beta hydrolase [Opitutales bacterium]
MAVFKILFWTAAPLAAAYALLALFAKIFAEKIAYPAPKPSYTLEELDGARLIETSLGEKICALFLESPGSKNLVIYSHGNGEDLLEILPRLEQIRSLGLNVLAYDYFGYGASEGKMSSKKMPAITEAVWSRAIALGFKPENITVMGYSMGSAAAVLLAAEKNPKALIVSSGFASAFRAVFPKNPLPWDILKNADLIKRAKCPVLIIHGTRDRIVPFWNAKILLKSAGEPKYFIVVRGAGHYNVWKLQSGAYFGAVKNFAENARLDKPQTIL